MELSRARVSFVVLDACRNNPLENRFRGLNRELGAIDATRGTLIAYATAPGSVAADGDGEHRLYSSQFLKALETPGLKAEEVFKRVRVGVARGSGGAQTRWESSSLTGDFVFNETVPLSSATPTLGAASASSGTQRVAGAGLQSGPGSHVLGKYAGQKRPSDAGRLPGAVSQWHVREVG
jgi:uncharacterized caspase-like protein